MIVPFFGFDLISFAVIDFDLFLMSLRYFWNAFPYLSSALLTNDLIVVSSSFLIFEAKSCSSFNSYEPKTVSRYSNALPFPVIPTFVNVDAGNNPLRMSRAFAFVEPL